MRISSLTLGLVDTNTYFIENDKKYYLWIHLVKQIKLLKN